MNDPRSQPNPGRQNEVDRLGTRAQPKPPGPRANPETGRLQPSGSNPQRFFELDVARFLAAVAVVLFHYTFRGYAAHDLSRIAYPDLGSIFKYGYLGVHLFFLISGFVIFLSAQGRDATRFAIARAARLLPAYWTGVTGTTVAILLLGGSRFDVDAYQYLANLTMLQKLLGFGHIDGVYWTLVVEVRFYFLVFLLLWLKRLDRFESLAWPWLLISVLAYLGLTGRFLDILLFPEWSPYFISGAVFFLAWQQNWNAERFLLLVCGFALNVLYAVKEAAQLHSVFKAEFHPAVVITSIAVFYTLFALTSVGAFKKVRFSKLASIGVLTYPLYLIHQYIGYILLNLAKGWIDKYLLLALVVAGMLVAAHGIHVRIERPGSAKLKQFAHEIIARFKLLGHEQFNRAG